MDKVKTLRNCTQVCALGKHCPNPNCGSYWATNTDPVSIDCPNYIPTKYTPNQPPKVEQGIAKDDKGKLEIMLVPPQIIRDIAEVRMYGNAKYHDPDNWMNVEVERYFNALLRHTLLFMENPYGVDEESGIKHYKHMACNLAFICEMMHAFESSEEEVMKRYDKVYPCDDGLDGIRDLG